ncbi:Alpha/Beta hydrolase protein [Bisporella sp. PMI_857]|nr:Alpha/Beta hydrolase protein [Bisporella sp. PMI_857]
MTKEVVSTQSREHAHSLTIWAWVLLLLKATGITCGLVIEAVKALSSKRRNGFGYYPYLAYKGMRDYQSGLNAIGIQNLLPSTSKTCKQFAKKHKLQQSTIQLSDGSAALWLGQPEASKIIISFHGGGYMAPILSSHISLAFGFAKHPQIDRKNVAVVVLQYDLACEDANHYPRQLQQAVALLDNLLHIQKISPSRITLIGDSAGAHLLISLLLIFVMRILVCHSWIWMATFPVLSLSRHGWK